MTTPPRLIARTLGVTFTTVAGILTVTFAVLTVNTRDRVRAAETEKLRARASVFTALEARRLQEQRVAIATLSENPTLKAALDTYFAERRFGGGTSTQEAALRATVAREADKLAAMTSADALVIMGPDGRVFASAGPSSVRWPQNLDVKVPSGTEPTFESVVVLRDGVSRIVGARLRLDDLDIGSLVVVTDLDADYAQELSTLSGAGVAIAVSGSVVVRTVPEAVTRDLRVAGDQREIRTLNGEEYAVRTLFASGPATVFTLTSIDSAARAATREAFATLAGIALGSFVLTGVCSFWLARMLTEPINRVAGRIGVMTAARDFHSTIELPGTSRELDALTVAFNSLMRSLGSAEAETLSAYLGAIRALAATLDARDPSTAGHSERVSAVSVQIGRQMRLAESDLDVLRLGALLHDIGKIGLTDEILRKPGPLTAEEFEQIKRHPAVGARILRQVPFLTPHLPIVELHHEQPDGKGYPFGLRGDDIPIAARIVHVADAFDAITSTRAYRPARTSTAAIVELKRSAGTMFDSDAVDALNAVLPSTIWKAEAALDQLLGRKMA